MPLKTWRARVRITGKATLTEVQIQASGAVDAKKLLEAQYGKGSVRTQVTEVR